MLEFISIETLKAVVVLMLAVALFYGALYSGKRAKEKKRSLKTFYLILFTLFVTLPLVDAYNTQINVKSKLQSFARGSTLICKGNDEKNYSVSKKEQWSIKSFCFSKESLLIRADRCEESRL